MQEENAKTSDVSIREYLDMLQRRKGILLQTFVSVFVVGVVITFMTKAQYRASARVLVEGKSYYVQQFDPGNPMGSLFSADAGHEVETQLEVIQGEKVVADTYKAAGIPPNTVKLQAKQSGSTDVIDVIAESRSPLYAQRFANTLPEVYLNYVTGNRRAEITRALKFAQDRLAEENKALRIAETSLQRFREKSHVSQVDVERDRRITNKVTAEGDASKTASDIAGLQARLQAQQQQQQQMSPFADTPTTATNLQIQLLQEQTAALETQRQGLLVNFKPTAPKVQEVDAQIVHLQKRLAEAPPMTTITQRVPNPALVTLREKMASTRTDLTEAQAHLATLRQNLSADASGLDRYGSLEREQVRIQREIDRHQGAVTQLTKNVDDMSLRQKATHDPVLIISPAGRGVQIAPKPMNNMLAATLVGLTLGLCFALLQEFLDDRINTPEEARRIFGAPALGYIPLIEEKDSRLLGQARSGNLLETYRVLRSNVMFSAVDAPICSIMITSTVPGEGKSMTAFNLAVAMALDGRRVILVDADLRRPTVHKISGLERRPGLTNVLVGELALDEALQDTHVRNLRVLTAGPLPPNPAEILNSQAMRNLHTAVRERADVIIYDTPPCLATADAQVLSADVDGVLYVAQFGETKKSAMRRSAELLNQAHARILGVVFNKIDISGKRDDYYYGYYRYYNYYQMEGEEGEGTRRRLSTTEFDLIQQRQEIGANGSDAGAAQAEAPRDAQKSDAPSGAALTATRPESRLSGERRDEREDA